MSMLFPQTALTPSATGARVQLIDPDVAPVAVEPKNGALVFLTMRCRENTSTKTFRTMIVSF